MVTVARFCNTDPVAVLRWPNPVFLDVQEVMEMTGEAEERREAWVRQRESNGDGY
ncbi:MAG: hypothetical protein P8Y00_00160 [Deltaproteobacteria bacterium]